MTGPADAPLAQQSKFNRFKAHYLTFAFNRAVASLTESKCKPWDDPELDMIEGFKFFSYLFGQLCMTS